MSPFVVCSGLDCSICSLLESVSVAFRWLLGVSAVTASFVLVAGGIIYLLNGTQKKYASYAKKTVTHAVSGFIFVLISFISVHTLIWVVGGPSQKSWWKFECNVNSENLLSGQDTASPNRIASIKISPLAAETEDKAPVLEGIGSLNKLTDSGGKIAVLEANAMDSQNLRQDLLNLHTGEKIRFLAGAQNITPEELQAFVKFENGYADNDIGRYDLGELLGKFQGVIDFSRDDGDLTIDAVDGDRTGPSGSYWGLDPDLNDVLDQIIQLLAKRTNQKIIAYKNARAEGSLNSCIDSGGDWKEFFNECTARKQIYGKGNIRCSQIHNPTMGCQCPKGKFLVNGNCIKDENSPTDEKEFPSGYCSGTALQERVCPATRCEGDNLATYPESGKDECINGVLKKHSCAAVKSEYNATCVRIKDVNDLAERENIAQKDPRTYDKLKESFSRSDPKNSPDNWGNKSGNTGGRSGGSGQTGGGNGTGGSSSSSSSGGSTDNTGGGDRTGTSPDGKMPPDLGAGNFNPTPSFKELAECIGFKDGKVPYNGVLVELENKSDPTNTNNPNRNVGRLFYLDRYGNIIGNNGDKNAGGLRSGAWTKGSGGTAWSTWTKEGGATVYRPEWIIFNAQTVHTSNSSGSPDSWSFRSGQGKRIGPKGENIRHNGQLDSSGGVQDMSGCNMHSGNKRSHSAGCKTMGGQERKNFTDYVKKMATQSNGNILMATLPADNTDQNSQRISSEYCGQMDPYAAVNKFKTLSQYRNYDPMQGY